MLGSGAGESDGALVDVLRSLPLELSKPPGFSSSSVLTAASLSVPLLMSEPPFPRMPELESSTVRSFVSAPFSETMILLTASVPVS